MPGEYVAIIHVVYSKVISIKVIHSLLDNAHI